MKVLSMAIVMAIVVLVTDLHDLSTPAASPSASPSASPVASPVAELTVTRVDPSNDFFVGASLIQGDEVERYIWDETATDFSGMGLQPVSFTVGNYDGGVWLFAEFQNVSDEIILTPFMQFEAIYNGTSFSSQTVWSPQYEVLPGESVYYTGYNVYGGTVLYGDWTEFNVTFDPGVEWGDDLSTLDLRLAADEGKIYNDGAADKSSVNIEGIGRDSSGVYMGTCETGHLDATVPAGLFVRIPDTVSLRIGSGRTCSSAGSEFAKRLGTSPVSVDSFLIIVPRP